MELKVCPCGKIPDKLLLSHPHVGPYAYVVGSCCADWHVEFHTRRYDFQTSECLDYATKAWNNAKRG